MLVALIELEQFRGKFILGSGSEQVLLIGQVRGSHLVISMVTWIGLNFLSAKINFQRIINKNLGVEKSTKVI